MSRYRWALRPGWILSHVFVSSCVVAFILLGFWQVSRLHERRADNALIAARQTAAPTAIEQVLSPDADAAGIDEAHYRNVVVKGTYRADQQVLIRNRTFDGSPGYEVATPLVLSDGSAAIVDRGWIPLTTGDDTNPDVIASYAPPSGPVTVDGLVALSQVRDGIGPTDPADGTLAAMARIDVARFQQQVPERLLPSFVTLHTQQPAQPGPLPLALPIPVLDDGPHLNYAGQWFIFATLTLIVYPLLLRRTARNKDQERREAAWAAAHGDGDEPGAGGGIGDEVLLAGGRGGPG